MIKFRSPHAAEFLMFDDIARRLIKALGSSGEVPGALMAADIPAALTRLKQTLATEAATHAAEPRQHDESDEPAVSLSHRAVPLIAMLEAAQAGDSYVMWER